MAGETPTTTKQPGATGSLRSRPPTTSVLRSAMYYQNRIISAEPPREMRMDSVSASPHAQSPVSYSDASGRAVKDQSHPNIKQSIARETIRGNSNSDNNKNFDPISATGISTTETGLCRQTPSRSTMDSRGIDIVITDTEDGSQRHELKRYTIWKKIYRVLQDNRMKGKSDAEQILAVGSPQDYHILKKVLNIVFLTVGIALLVAVIIVIVYTYIGRYPCLFVYVYIVV